LFQKKINKHQTIGEKKKKFISYNLHVCFFLLLVHFICIYYVFFVTLDKNKVILNINLSIMNTDESMLVKNIFMQYNLKWKNDDKDNDSISKNLE